MITVSTWISAEQPLYLSVQTKLHLYKKKKKLIISLHFGVLQHPSCTIYLPSFKFKESSVNVNKPGIDVTCGPAGLH